MYLISDCLTPDPSYPTIPLPSLHNGSIFPLSKIYIIGNTFLTKRFLQLDQELAWQWWKMVPVIFWGLHWFWPNQPVINFPSVNKRSKGRVGVAGKSIEWNTYLWIPPWFAGSLWSNLAISDWHDLVKAMIIFIEYLMIFI